MHIPRLITLPQLCIYQIDYFLQVDYYRYWVDFLNYLSLEGQIVCCCYWDFLVGDYHFPHCHPHHHHCHCLVLAAFLAFCELLSHQQDTV
jgi:hypothetical protein